MTCKANNSAVNNPSTVTIYLGVDYSSPGNSCPYGNYDDASYNPWDEVIELEVDLSAIIPADKKRKLRKVHVKVGE